MSTIYTRRVVLARLDVPAVQKIFTHTGPDVLVLRDIILTNLHTAPQIARLFLSSGSLNYDVFRLPAAAALTSYRLELRQEMLSGESLSLQSDLGVLTAMVTGYFLS